MYSHDPAFSASLQFVKTSAKLLKNVALKEVQNRQCVIGIKVTRPSHVIQIAVLVSIRPSLCAFKAMLANTSSDLDPYAT